MVDKPDAFLSYTRFDDRRRKISEFRTWLSDAVEEVSGHSFDIFQDIEGIGLGKKWQDVLDEMLDQARFFIPILTPKFFNSGPCRDELTKFLELERKSGRQDLVLPIYWIDCPVLEEGYLKAKDELAQAIDERQRWDWRRLRLEPFDSKEVQRDLLALGSEIERARRNVLRVVEISDEVMANGKAKPKPSTKLAPKLKTISSQPKTAATLIAPEDESDKRFVSSMNRLKHLPDGANLAELNWEDFRHLIRDLFEKEFADSAEAVRVTRASRNGGVDIAVFDADPIHGGKIVIQAKRFSKPVGPAAVRELYGVVIKEAAIKGILVTTSDFTASAYDEAKNLPINLIDQRGLISLFEKHGRKFENRYSI